MNHEKIQGAESFYSFLFIIACLLLTLLPFFSIGDDFFVSTGEDQFVENLTALFGFIGAYVCFQIFRLRRRLLSKKAYLFLLGAFFLFFAGGEEISWGQRLITMKPVIWSNEWNTQREFNIHNIRALEGLLDDLASGGIVLVAGILPLLTYASSKVKRLCVRCGIPLMPKSVCFGVWMGCLFLILIPNIQSYGGFQVLLSWDLLFGFELSTIRFSEFRECYLIFMLFAYIFADYFYLLKYGSIYDFKK